MTSAAACVVLLFACHPFGSPRRLLLPAFCSPPLPLCFLGGLDSCIRIDVRICHCARRDGYGVRACTGRTRRAFLFGWAKATGRTEYSGQRNGKWGVTHRATERASASASLILRISSARSSDVDFTSRLYQWISLFFCHRPVGALVLWPR